MPVNPLNLSYFYRQFVAPAIVGTLFGTYGAAVRGTGELPSSGNHPAKVLQEISINPEPTPEAVIPLPEEIKSPSEKAPTLPTTTEDVVHPRDPFRYSRNKATV